MEICSTRKGNDMTDLRKFMPGTKVVVKSTKDKLDHKAVVQYPPWRDSRGQVVLQLYHHPHVTDMKNVVLESDYFGE